MLAAIAVLTLAQIKPVDYFDRCLKAHESIKAAQVTIRSNTAVGDPTKPGTYTLAFLKPGSVRLRVQLPAIRDQQASDRTFAVSGSRVVAYDAKSNESLSRTLQGSGSLAEKLEAILGPLNDSVMAVLEPSRLAEIMKPLRALKDWTTSSEGGDVVLVRRSNAQSSARWVIDGKTLLVKRITLTTGGSAMDWSYVYGPKPSSVAFKPPADAVAVSEFTEKTAPPTYRDSKARQIGTAAISALDRLRSAHFILTTEDGVSRVWVSAGKIREELKGRAWAYDGQNLTAQIDATKRHFAQRKGRSSAIDSLGDIKMESAPFVRNLLLRRNPLNAILREGYTVSHVGTMSLNGVKCVVLQASATGVKHMLTLRADNYLPIEIRTENRFPGAEEAIASEIGFKYLSVGQKLADSLFKIEAKRGYASGAFPKPRPTPR